MKGLLTLSFLMLSALAYSEEHDHIEMEVMLEEPASSIDHFYLDEIRHRDAAPERIDETRNEMKDNPRNAAFAASFGKIHSRTPPP